jgi:hypothetical protein
MLPSADQAVTDSSRRRFDHYFWGTLMLLLVGTGIFFAAHLAWDMMLVSFLLVCFGAVCAVAWFAELGERSAR